jgi:hypothetical protein
MSVLEGKKTYIIIVLQCIYDILAASGVVIPDALSQPNVIIIINAVLAALAVSFNYTGRKRIMGEFGRK